MNLTRICAAEDVSPGEMLRFDSGQGSLLLSNVDGEYFVTQDTCTHDDWSLSEGYLEDGIVECTLHWARFCVRTGAVKALPASTPLRTYVVKVEDGDVMVDLDSEAAA